MSEARPLGPTAPRKNICLFIAVSVAMAILMWPVAVRADDVAHERKQRKHNPIKIEAIRGLHFGDMVPSQFGTGTVSINVANGRKTVGGGVIDLGGRHSRAQYRIKGKPKARFIIEPMERTTLYMAGAELPVVDIVTIPEREGRFGPDGRAIVVVGGTLLVDPRQDPGSYRGHLLVTVVYQ